MKRCPLCEFIYEDDQTCCDMDGNKLVVDNNALSLTEGAPARTGFRGSDRVLSVGLVVGVMALGVSYASLEHVVSQDPAASIPAQVTVGPSPDPVPRKPAGVLPTIKTDQETPGVSTVLSTDSAVSVATNGASVTGERQPRQIGPQSNRLTLPTLPRATVQTTTTNSFKVVPRRRGTAPQTPAHSSTGKPPSTQSRKDSKLISIVKKTGRILTKPFKL